MGHRDESDFVAFAEACRPAMRRTAYLMCGDWERAADFTQEALVRVYVAWPRLEQDHGLRTYARKAVVSVAIEQARKRSSREVPAAHLGDRPVADAAEHVVDRVLLMTALAELPPRQRACVVLRYYDDLSVEAVAEALGCRTGTVKSQTARGLEALRAAYSRHGGELSTGRVAQDQAKEVTS
jgi:RNA polymerase sigma-70 factor (sigma-E family)